MDTTIDTLAIEIETEAGKSFKNIDVLIERLDKLSSNLTQITTHYSKLQNVIKSVNNIKIKDVKIPKASVQKTTKSNVVDTGDTKSLLNSNVSSFTEKTINIDINNKEDLDNVDKELEDVNKNAKDTKRNFDKLKKSINAVSATSKNINKLSKILTGTSNSAKKLGEAFKKSFAQSITSSIKKFGLAMIGVRSLFTALRASVQEYMQYDTQLEDTLRNNWAVLGSLLAPALERIIQLFGIAVAYVRAFIKALTGIDLVARANKKSMDSLGDSAKKTLGNLAKFDNLNVVEFPSNEGSGNDIPPLTTPEIDTSKIDWFVKYIKEGNWYGLGMEIGRKFNDGLRAIDFSWFTQVVTQWAKNIGDLFNGLTDGTDWALVGQKIAGGLNTALAFVNTFFDTYNFDNLGKSVATGLNNIIDTVDWSGIGRLFANKLVSIIDFGTNFVENFNFTGLGVGLGTSINKWITSIDWGTLANTIADSIDGLINTVATTLSVIDWEAVGKSVSDFLGNTLTKINDYMSEVDYVNIGNEIYNILSNSIKGIDWGKLAKELIEFLIRSVIYNFTGINIIKLLAGFLEPMIEDIKNYFREYIGNSDSKDWLDIGKNIILGILKGILDGLKNIGVWIYNNVLTPVVNGVKTAFDMHSPSKVMEELGRLVWDGFLSAFTNVKEDIKQKWEEVKEGIKEKIREIVDDIKTTFSWNNISSTFTSIKTKIGDVFTQIKNNIGSRISEAFNTIKNTFTSSKIGAIFQKVFNKIKSIFQTIGTTVGNAVGESFANVINTVINFVEKTINKFIKAINKAIGVINEIPGVSIKKLDVINIPDVKLATGTNRIESEGLYHLHKNEAVVPEKYNPAVNDDLYNNKGVIEALGMVYDAINNLDITNVVNLGNKTLYKETVKYAKSQNEIYGENVMSF